MTQTPIVHLIDSDINRRAAIAHDFYLNNIHTEIYEGLWEFAQKIPSTGAILASDSLNSSDSMELFDFFRHRSKHLPFAMFAVDPLPEMIVRAMQAGAISYLPWPFGAKEIERALISFQSRKAKEFAAQEKALEAERLVSKLSPREYQVLQELVGGRSNKGIAIKLGISPRTVEIHRANMMAKLNAGRTADAVRIGLYAGLDQAEDRLPNA